MRSFLMYAVAFVLLLPCTGIAQPMQETNVAVQILNEDGAPAAGAEVVCVLWNHDQPPNPAPIPPESKGVADAKGLCRFTLPAPEHATFFVYAQQGLQCARAQVWPFNEGDEPTVVEMAVGQPRRGFIRTRDGEPLEGVKILVNRRMPLAVTDADGIYEIQSMPDLNITLVADGYAWADIHTRPLLEVMLAPGAPIILYAVDEQGQPLAHAEVEWTSREQSFRGHTDVEGKLRVPSMLLGSNPHVHINKYTEKASWSGSGLFTLNAGTDNAFTVTCERTLRDAEVSPEERVARQRERAAQYTTISGQVVRADDGAPVRTHIMSSDTGGSEFDYYGRRTGQSDDEGHFTLDEIRKGSRLFLRAEPLDDLLYPVEGKVKVEVGDAPVENLLLTVAPGAAVHGRVIGPDQQTLREGQVSLSGESQHRTHFLPQEGSRFVFRNLSPGDYVVSYESERVELNDLGPGEARNDVAIKMPAPGPVVAGTLMDPAGAPIGAANVQFAHFEQRLYGHGETNAKGQFTVQLEAPGPYVFTANLIHSVVLPGEANSGSGMELPVQGEAQVDVPEAGVSDLNFVAERPVWPKAVLAGQVVDEAGNPIAANMQLVYEQFRTDRVQLRDGAFSQDRLPDVPFLIELTAEGYEARLLEEGVDFERTDRNLKIVLEKGPFEDDERIWTQVTGRPNTYEAFDAMLNGEYFQQRRAYYERLAQPEPQRPEPPPQPLPPETVDVHVVDEDGEAVTRLIVQPARRNYGSGEEMTRLTAVPRGDASEVMTDPQGRYTLPNPSLIDTEETAQELVWVAGGKNGEALRTVTLGAPAQLAVRITDYHGRPVPDAALIPAEFGYVEPHMLPQLDEADADGWVLVEDLPAGRYQFLAYMSRQNHLPTRMVSVALEAGETVRKQLTIPIADPGTLEAQLVLWEQERRHERVSDDFVETLRQIDPEQQERIAVLVRRQLAQAPGVTVRNARAISFLLTVAGELATVLNQPLPEVTSLLGKETQEEAIQNQLLVREAITNAFQALRKASDVPSAEYWAQLVRKADARPWLRLKALAALGALETKAAETAWTALREESMAADNAPTPQTQYTHAERMAETAQWAAIAAGLDLPPLDLERAWVDEDFERGRIDAGEYRFHFRRAAGDWRLSDMELRPMPIP